MKKIGFAIPAALAIAFGGSAALAADMPLKAPPPIVVYNWTGCYVGLSIGENYGRSDGFVNTSASTLGGNPAAPLPPGFNRTGAFNLSGFIGGAYGGCNYQFAGTGWVIGAEVDWSKTNKEGQVFPVANQQAVQLFGNPNDQWWLQERWLGTARLRLGYAVTDKWLWYVTGGGAWAKVDASETILGNPRPPENAFQSTWRGGWTVGAGTEYAVGYGWSIRGEFLYVDLGHGTTFTNIPCCGNQGIDTFTNLRTNLRDYVWRFGMSYKFGWVGKSPVVAKY
jgi:outer membrane immunogenic protein